MTLDWLIVGGGIHGVHLAVRLIGEAGVPPDRLRIVDPADRLLARWFACTATVGMTHLRSSAAHHLDIDPQSLWRFAGTKKNRKRGLFAAPYNRPSLALFNAHCQRVVVRYALEELHVKGRAVACSVRGNAVEVALSDGVRLEADRAVLAMGTGERPPRPRWALQEHPRIQHVFDLSFGGWPTEPGETVVVVGGGISACQSALRLIGEGHQVHLIARHPVREHQFDSDPGWLGPKLMRRFEREDNFSRRRHMIQNARHRGSVPPDVRRKLRRAVDKGRVVRHEAHIEDLVIGCERLDMRLSTGVTVSADRVFLATGLASTRPGGAMIDDLVASASLPCAACGFPIVDRALRWHPRIHVCGPLAELELGPVSNNIAGARRAGDRLLGG